MELNQLTIHELQEKIKAGETTSTEIVQAVFRRIDAVEKDVHAYILLTREKALVTPIFLDFSRVGILGRMDCCIDCGIQKGWLREVAIGTKQHSKTVVRVVSNAGN